MSNPHVPLDPDPLNPADLDAAYAQGFADAWEALQPHPRRSWALFATVLVLGVLIYVAFAAGRASAAPRSAPQQPVQAGRAFAEGPTSVPVEAIATPSPEVGIELAMESGIASYVKPSYGDRYLALPGGPGIRVTICGPAACVRRTSTDAGPDLEMQRAGRVADLSYADFATVCGCTPELIGLVRVTVAYGPAVTPPPTETEP